MLRSMNTLMAALLVALGAASLTVAQANKKTDTAVKKAKSGTQPGSSEQGQLKEELIKMEKASWDAWKARDGAFYQKFLSDDHIEMGGGGPSSKADVVSFVGSPVCVVDSWSVDKFQFALLNPNTALLTYYAEQKTQCNGKAVPSPAWVTSLYVRRDGRWQNAVYQQTPKS